MIAFDTDVLSQILAGNSRFVNKAAAIPLSEQAIPIIVIEDIMRGRLNIIRQAEAGTASIDIARAYQLFEDTFRDLRRIRILSHTQSGETLYQEWRRQGIHVSTHDLRIAAIAVSHSAKLISRNRSDFAHVPGLNVEFWG